MIRQQLQKNKNDFCNDLFVAVIDLPESRQIIDNAPKTEDIFIDSNFFIENDSEDDDKKIIDNFNYGDKFARIVRKITLRKFL